jgi:YD repeat-containing protein
MLTRKLTDETSQVVPYSTNGQTRTWTYTYNRTGEVLTALLPRTDVTAKTTYAYAGGTSGGTLLSVTDALGHVTTVNTATGGGRPKKITDPNSVHTTLAWTPRNWLSSSVLATSAGNLTTAFSYDSAGNLTKTTLPDNSYLSYGYDAAHRVTSITNALSESQGITYDSAGDVTQQLWKNASSVTKRQHTATFDALGRMLTSVGGQSQTTSYSYDKNGNVLTITDPLSHTIFPRTSWTGRIASKIRR